MCDQRAPARAHLVRPVWVSFSGWLPAVLLSLPLRDDFLVRLRLGLKHALQDFVAALGVAFRLVLFWSLHHANSPGSIAAQKAYPQT